MDNVLLVVTIAARALVRWGSAYVPDAMYVCTRSEACSSLMFVGWSLSQKIAYSKSKSDVIAKMDGTFTERKRKKAEEGVPPYCGWWLHPVGGGCILWVVAASCGWWLHPVLTCVCCGPLIVQLHIMHFYW